MRVEFLGEVEEVDRFVGKPVHPVEEVVEPLQHSQECSEAKEGEESAAVEFPKKSDDDEKVSVEKAVCRSGDRSSRSGDCDSNSSIPKGSARVLLRTLLLDDEASDT
jgi:hypothetical protein